MKLLRIISILVLAIIGTAQAQNTITIFADCDYRGNADELKPGRYYLNSTRVGERNVSSVRVPRGMKAVLYSGPDVGSGEKLRLTEDLSCLKNAGWNDRAVTLLVEYDGTDNNNNNDNNNKSNGNKNNNNNNYNNNYNNNNNNNSSGSIAVFSDCEYKGRKSTLYTGRIDYNQLGVGEDAISSLRIPSGITVTVYEGTGFRGNNKTFTHDVSCLLSDFNDKISSIIISDNNGNNNNNYNNNNNNNGYNNGNNNNDNNNDNSAVTVYGDSWFKGERAEYGPGSYDLYNNNLSGNITSFSLKSGYVIIVYDRENFKGNSRTFDVSSTSLSSAGWNDKIRSFIVRRK